MPTPWISSGSRRMFDTVMRATSELNGSWKTIWIAPAEFLQLIALDLQQIDLACRGR